MRTAPSALAQSYGTNGFKLQKERRGKLDVCVCVHASLLMRTEEKPTR